MYPLRSECPGPVGCLSQSRDRYTAHTCTPPRNVVVYDNTYTIMAAYQRACATHPLRHISRGSVPQNIQGISLWGWRWGWRWRIPTFDVSRRAGAIGAIVPQPSARAPGCNVAVGPYEEGASVPRGLEAAVIVILVRLIAALVIIWQRVGRVVAGNMGAIIHVNVAVTF